MKTSDKNKESKIKKDDDKVLRFFGWAILVITLISLVILAIYGGISSYNEITADDGMGIAGIPLSLEYALALFISTIISILIIFAITYFFIWKKIKDHLDVRKENVRTNIELAAYKNEKAEKEYEHAKKIVSNANNEAKKILDEVKINANDEKKTILDDAKKQSEKIMSSTQKQIKEEKKSMEDDIKKEIIETSILAAEKIIEKKMNSATNKKMIEELIESLNKE